MKTRSRRTFLSLVTAAAVGFALSGEALSQTAAEQTVIGIANLGPHPSLTKTIDGFKTEMAKAGYIDGKNVRYAYSDANFTQALMPQMFSQLVTKQPSLILTLTTSVSQVARSAVPDHKIPLIFAEVTDPVAAGLVPSWTHGGDRFTGASDLQDFDAMLAFAKRLLPGVKSFGVLYSPGEANDVVTNRALEAAAKRAGVTFKAVSVDAVNDLAQRAQLLKGVGFVYLTGSNLVQSAIPTVAASMARLRVPIISSETEAIKQGMASASFAVSLESVGANAARLAVRVLKGESTASLPVAKPAASDYVTSISRREFTKLGLPVPASFESCQCFIN